MILKIDEDPNFDPFLSGDQGFVTASAKLAASVHEGATRREGLIAMDEWMEAVDNIALVIWNSRTKPGGLRKLPVIHPTPMANDLRLRFNLLTKNWRREFGNLTKDERERLAMKKTVDALRKEMVKAKRAIAKVERGAGRVRTTNFWKKMGKEAGSHGWWQQLKTRKPRQSYLLPGHQGNCG